MPMMSYRLTHIKDRAALEVSSPSLPKYSVVPTNALMSAYELTSVTYECQVLHSYIARRWDVRSEGEMQAEKLQLLQRPMILQR